MLTYASDQFYFHHDIKKLTADASDLGLQAGELPYSQVYNDAADVGIAIRSHRTGKLAIYTLKSTDEKDGNIRAWEYAPAPRHESMMCPKGDVARWEDYKNTSVVIFND